MVNYFILKQYIVLFFFSYVSTVVSHEQGPGFKSTSWLGPSSVSLACFSSLFPQAHTHTTIKHKKMGG